MNPNLELLSQMSANPTLTAYTDCPTSVTSSAITSLKVQRSEGSEVGKP